MCEKFQPLRRSRRQQSREHTEAVVNAGVPVTLAVDGGEPVDAGSALMIMTLGAGNGAQVTVESDDAGILDQIAALVEQDLDA